MKNGKKPSWNQRKLIQQLGLDPHDWLVVKDQPTEMVIVHRFTQTVRTINKEKEYEP